MKACFSVFAREAHQLIALVQLHRIFLGTQAPSISLLRQAQQCCHLLHPRVCCLITVVATTLDWKSSEVRKGRGWQEPSEGKELALQVPQPESWFSAPKVEGEKWFSELVPWLLSMCLRARVCACMCVRACTQKVTVTKQILKYINKNVKDTKRRKGVLY